MEGKVKLSFVMPVYRGAETIATALQSVYAPAVPLPDSIVLEVLVVDDGSPDREQLHAVLRGFPQIRLLIHETNQGMISARNTGFRASTGDVVTILDCDDALVPDWPQALCRILAEWPPEVNLCFSACVNPEGRLTVSEPDYTGPLTLEAKMNERCTGEYLPLFRGPYIRERGYIDLGTRRDCGPLSYLTFLQDGPAWVTTQVLRLYNCLPGPEMRKWTSQDFSVQIARCYEAVFDKFGPLYARTAPRTYRTKQLRYAIYLLLAQRSGAWRAWRRGAHWTCLRETAGTFLMLALGRSFTRWAVEVGKKRGFIKLYG